MTLPTDTDERMGQFHASAQEIVWEWAKRSKVKADTMDPLSCLTYAIVQQLEKTYQEAKAAEDPKAETKLSKLRCKFGL